MPFPRSQLDVIVVSLSESKTLNFETMENLWRHWLDEGYMIDGTPTDIGLGYWGLGNVQQVRFEYSERHRLYANHQGGYRVNCPSCSHIMTSEFVNAVQDWRLSGALPSSIELMCPKCKVLSMLDEMKGRPEIAFSKGAIVFSGVEHIQLSEELHCDLYDVFGSTALILRRVG